MFGKKAPEPSNTRMRHPFMHIGPERFNPVPQITETEKTTGGGSLSKNLDRIQQILNAVERTVPYIEEYGPMVKNLPKMYQMMKAFKDFDKEDAENAPKEAKKQTATDNVTTPAQTNALSAETKEKRVNTETARVGQSKPKLFI